MTRAVVSFLSIIIMVVAPLSPALALEQIGWRDLTIPVEPQDDPYYGLAFEQRVNLEKLFLLESQRDKQDAPSADADERRKRLISELSIAGLDPTTLIEKNKSFLAKITAQRSSVREEWDGADIKIPGYMLPLEFDGDQVTEFLLVPYVGACIHTPPPPANQIIHVKPTESFKADGLFTPVWVSGKLAVEQTHQSVGLSDGTTGFAVGYSLQATQIEEYTQ